MLHTILVILLSVTILGTLAVLAAGFISMSRGGDFNARHGNRLMRLRVMLQGAAVAILAALIFAS